MFHTKNKLTVVRQFLTFYALLGLASLAHAQFSGNVVKDTATSIWTYLYSAYFVIGALAILWAFLDAKFIHSTPQPFRKILTLLMYIAGTASITTIIYFIKGKFDVSNINML